MNSDSSAHHCERQGDGGHSPSPLQVRLENSRAPELNQSDDVDTASNLVDFITNEINLVNGTNENGNRPASTVHAATASPPPEHASPSGSKSAICSLIHWLIPIIKTGLNDTSVDGESNQPAGMFDNCIEAIIEEGYDSFTTPQTLSTRQESLPSIDANTGMRQVPTEDGSSDDTETLAIVNQATSGRNESIRKREQTVRKPFANVSNGSGAAVSADKKTETRERLYHLGVPNKENVRILYIFLVFSLSTCLTLSYLSQVRSENFRASEQNQNDDADAINNTTIDASEKLEAVVFGPAARASGLLLTAETQRRLKSRRAEKRSKLKTMEATAKSNISPDDTGLIDTSLDESNQPAGIAPGVTTESSILTEKPQGRLLSRRKQILKRLKREKMPKHGEHSRRRSSNPTPFPDQNHLESAPPGPGAAAGRMTSEESILHSNQSSVAVLVDECPDIHEECFGSNESPSSLPRSISMTITKMRLLWRKKKSKKSHLDRTSRFEVGTIRWDPMHHPKKGPFHSQVKTHLLPTQMKAVTLTTKILVPTNRRRLSVRLQCIPIVSMTGRKTLKKTRP